MECSICGAINASRQYWVSVTPNGTVHFAHSKTCDLYVQEMLANQQPKETK